MYVISLWPSNMQGPEYLSGLICWSCFIVEGCFFLKSTNQKHIFIKYIKNYFITLKLEWLEIVNLQIIFCASTLDKLNCNLEYEIVDSHIQYLIININVVIHISFWTKMEWETYCWVSSLWDLLFLKFSKQFQMWRKTNFTSYERGIFSKWLDNRLQWVPHSPSICWSFTI